ncbi:hypothetical protein [Candidatus Sulfurimonas baltica]|uniref:Uncharacterized protein n=1 Tax=Candidatus Sulfurimonas baltica TaxID=2740404 RepID=A0A7S7RMH2_9BACT|nr:hypothetical protein [Candidatus Sulfurimonas baltica]QOY51418.1 hypothetical protein HUE88_09840 [Candidatus Sulfurimonas baltica]
MLINTSSSTDRNEILRFYIKRSLKKLLSDCGYEILKMKNIVDYKNKPIKEFLKKTRYLIIPKIFRTINTLQFWITAKKNDNSDT